MKDLNAHMKVAIIIFLPVFFDLAQAYSKAIFISTELSAITSIYLSSFIPYNLLKSVAALRPLIIAKRIDNKPYVAG